MANYQEMYATLFQQITAAINELQKVQRQTEEMYLSSTPTNTGSIKIAEDEKQVHNMEKILQSLYYGELCPVEQYRPIIEQHVAMRKKHYKSYEGFIKKIGSPLDKEFIEIMDEQIDKIPFELSEVFINGFRLGAKMMIEVLEQKY